MTESAESGASKRAPDGDGPRTRGGWAPTGTAAKRREKRNTRTLPRGEETERALLEAAREVFARDGFFAARINDIVDAAGVSRGTFYTYFPDKRSVFDSLYDVFHGELRSAVLLPPGRHRASPAQELRLTNRQFLEFLASNADLVAVIEQVAAVDADVASKRDEIRRLHLSRIQSLVERWKRAGHSAADVDSEAASLALVTMLAGISHYRADGSLSRSIDWVVDAISDVWGRAVGLDVEAS